MKLVLLVASLFCLTLPAHAEDDFELQLGRPANPFDPVRAGESPLRNNEVYQAYLARRAERRYNALQLRRTYNQSRGPAVYYRYNPNALSPFWSGIQSGWVQQPPIPRPIYRPIYRPICPPPVIYVPSYSD